MLGSAGECWVVKSERKRLADLGRHALANAVEHVAKTRGDGLGYDVLSFEEDGTERHIEVKTTRYGISTPFFLQASELEHSREVPDLFKLYRLFA